MTEYVVELRNVSKFFGSVAAVRNVTLGIREGEFFSLLGPSGCGKTTTLRLIAGFEVPTAGEVYIGGHLQRDTPPYRRPVNTVFQNYALFPHLTVYENVAFGLRMRRLPEKEVRRRVYEALEMVRLSGLERRRPRELSGGQQQRVALARALVNRPRVLLLDEPLGALDQKLRKAMQLELKNLQQQVSITFIYVTHDQEEAMTMSDRIAVMDQGMVLQVGTPEEIYERPVSRFVADFIGETNLLEGKVVEVWDHHALVLVNGAQMVCGEVPEGIAVGQRVTVAIRPERISLHAQPPNPMAVPGIVRDVVYTGADIRYTIRMAEEITVLVRSPNTGNGSTPHFLRNETVYLSWRPESARLLRT
ncbi:MAG: ABC transporter ATP-binding protein [Thermoflexia bacterium]|nr:MAG: ABC transporter ATP-binding protein [Thermoflexia bacterium]